MANKGPETISVKAFRKREKLSGEVRVVAGSRTHKGVPRQDRRASCKSLKGAAGTDAASDVTVGESAHTSAAHATSRDTDAALVTPDAEPAGGTPSTKGQAGSKTTSESLSTLENEVIEVKRECGGPGDDIIETLGQERAELDGGVPLPDDGVAFVDAVNVNIDLIRLTDLLLRGRDERSSKTLLERLLEMRYGKNARASLESPSANGR